MKKISLILLVLVFSLLGIKGSAAQEEVSYTIGRGDTLEISVWGYPELIRTITVRPDGKISFPLLEQELIAEGKTPQQLNEEMIVHLSKEIKAPKVTVIVTGFGSKRIWVLGEVANPGVYPFIGKLTTLEAIIQAGGYKDSACLDSVMVIRNVSVPYPDVFSVNLAKVIRKKRNRSDIQLQAGDVVYLPRHFFAKVDNFLSFFRSNVNYGFYYDLNND